ncbi:MAG: hypothetical protein HOM67_00330, partial [Halieaceae bacterium]|nr:hypothetical protein [Halieaceae bacterium]
MKPEILLIAEPHEEWPKHVMELIAGRLVTLRLDPQAPLASDTRFESVRVLVGAPQDAARWVVICPKLEWIQSTWAGIDALASQIP